MFEKGTSWCGGRSSGMTSDRLFPVLEREGDSELLCRVASLLASGQVLEATLEVNRLGG